MQWHFNFTTTFSHFAEAFIQSNLKMMETMEGQQKA